MTMPRWLLVAALSAAVASPASAQRLVRHGFWMDLGGGYGRERVVCLRCQNDRGANGKAVTFSIGGTASRYVLIGVEGQIWTGNEAQLHEILRSVNLVVHWYPWGTRNGFFVRGGTGIVDGTAIASDSSGQQVTVKGFGLGISASLGYDFPITNRLALTFTAGDQIAALGDLVAVGGLQADDTIAYLSRLSIAITFR